MTSDAPLDGTHALVIGGSSGIGLATARLLAADGCRVTIAGRDEQRLVDALRVLAAEGLEVHPCPCDTLRPMDVADAVAFAADGDSLEIAVTVPGGGSPSRLVDYDPDQFSAEVDRNVRPVFLLLKYAVPAMPPGGSIVAVSSTAAAFSTKGLASYKTGKAAVDALVEVAADELGEEGIRVNSVRPGLTRTASTTGLFADDDMMAAFLANQPLARGGEADDIAQAIRYLAGPESSWVTGQHLTVDGGHTLRAFPDMRPPRPDGQESVSAAAEEAEEEVEAEIEAAGEGETPVPADA
ncbi:SDR family NAD(P)-dependent oxidoreductase [Rhabdothermincola salaria]|uniref:SDR family NAD(P)-dependent oxidoreductase n=1 Tax=Rhabdothermincola salaria TaxID=2903142 RepID=UPI001E407774|nr:SDR family oxidoreductase [Rhabdothermincola salaria]MCD9623884.1 SDR family oxidoreductase [Rhabdothermincola salaria]